MPIGPAQTRRSAGSGLWQRVKSALLTLAMAAFGGQAAQPADGETSSTDDRVVSRRRGDRDQKTLELESEVRMARYLEPFKLGAPVPAVLALVGAGFVKPEMLCGVTEQELLPLIPHRRDVHKILLAAWLYSVGEQRHCGRLGSYGCGSLAELANYSDAQLQQAGLVLLGTRRKLQVHIDRELAYLAKAPRSAIEGGAAAKPRAPPPRSRAAGKRAAAAGGSSLAAPASAPRAAAPRQLAADEEALAFAAAANRWQSANDALDVKLRAEAWNDVQKTMSSACLLGSAPGETPEHYGAQAPSYYRIACASGSGSDLCVHL